MKDNPFHLREKSVLLLGPLSTLTSALIFQLVEMGADVALAGEEHAKAQRFAGEIANLGEVNSHSGKLHPLAVKPDEKNGREVVSLAAEALGGIDVYVDAQLRFAQADFSAQFASDNYLPAAKQRLAEDYLIPLTVSHVLMQAFERRRKGRIVYLLPDLAVFPPADAGMMSARMALLPLSKSLSPLAAKHDSTLNCVAVGLTEEYLASKFPGVSAHEAEKKYQENVQKTFPGAKICDTHRIAKLVAFLTSPLGAGISGQMLGGKSDV